MPAVTSLTKIAPTPYLLRYKVTTDGADPVTIPVPNAQLLGDMIPDTPLYRQFDIAGLTQPQALDRCMQSPKMAIRSQVQDTFPAFAVNVDVDGDGRPIMLFIFPIKDFPITMLVDLIYRHSISR